MITSILLLLIYLFCFVTTMSTAEPGFTSFYDTIMKRAPFDATEHLQETFISVMHNWLIFVLFAAFVFILINHFLLLIKVALRHITEAIVGFCIFLSFAYYYYAYIRLARYEIVMSDTHIIYFVTAGLSLLIAVFKIILLIRDHKGVKKGHLVFPALVLSAFGVMFFSYGIKGYGICKEYNVNYGIYGQEEHVLRTDLEDAFIGNFANQAVDTEKGLFFIDYESQAFPTCIKRMDSNGEISTVYRSSDRWLWTIGYDDGYLFVNCRNDLIRIDPDTGADEKIIDPEDPEYISDACVVDGKLYYVLNDDKAPRIMVCEIEDGELSEAQLYISDIDLIGVWTYDPDADLLEVYIAGEPAHPGWSHGSWQQRAEGMYRYYITEGQDEELDRCTALAICSEDGSKEFMYYVDAINVHNGMLYYVLLNDHGFDICRCDLDGSNTEVLDSVDLGAECRDLYVGGIRIIIGQGRIVVSGFGLQEQLGNDEGTICYVTDLV